MFCKGISLWLSKSVLFFFLSSWIYVHTRTEESRSSRSRSRRRRIKIVESNNNKYQSHWNAIPSSIQFIFISSFYLGNSLFFFCCINKCIRKVILYIQIWERFYLYYFESLWVVLRIWRIGGIVSRNWAQNTVGRIEVIQWKGRGKKGHSYHTRKEGWMKKKEWNGFLYERQISISLISLSIFYFLCLFVFFLNRYLN